ncbi:MAG: hypothetical protein ACLQDM_06035 [Bradyrhizobium sp.]
MNKWGFSTVFQGAPKPIQRAGKSAIRKPIFRFPNAAFPRRMPAGVDDFGRKCQTAGELLEKPDASAG